MRAVVFLGPTLSAAEARQRLEAEFLPPAARGDVYRAAARGAEAIGIVDGYFDRVPSIWHKEILWAMDRGVRVFGSASMGALRAAELADYGMRGVGTIYERFRSGELEDDDEVVVTHAAAESGYRALSEAMVNIRVTVDLARTQEVVSAPTAQALLRVAKRLFYPERLYPILVAELRDIAPAAELARFEGWWPTHKVDCKREDALTMLRAMADAGTSAAKDPRSRYVFAHTDAWETLKQREDLEISKTERGSSGWLVEELRRRGQLDPAWQGALVRALALRLGQVHHRSLDRQVVDAAMDEFRRERNLLTTESLAAWCKAQQLADSDIDRYFRDEAVVRQILAMTGPEVERYLADYLRSTGEMTTLLQDRPLHDDGTSKS